MDFRSILLNLPKKYPMEVTMKTGSTISRIEEMISIILCQEWIPIGRLFYQILRLIMEWIVDLSISGGTPLLGFDKVSSSNYGARLRRECPE